MRQPIHWSLDNRACELPTPCSLAAIGASSRFVFSGIPSYDATYLELAQRLNATLASFDRQLNRAAAAIGVALFAGA